MAKWFCNDTEGDICLFRRQFTYPDRERKLVNRHCQGMIDDQFQDISCSFGSTDGQSPGKFKFIEDVQAYDMVKMKMAQQEIYRLSRVPRDVPVDFVKPVSRIKNNIRFVCFYKRADGVSRVCIIPAVCSQEDHSQD